MAREPDRIEPRVKHRFIGWGYDETICEHCRISTWDTRTTYCDEVANEKREKLEKTERRHAATEEAIRVARVALSAEQWDLLGLSRVAPHRDRDFIRV